MGPFQSGMTFHFSKFDPRTRIQVLGWDQGLMQPIIRAEAPMDASIYVSTDLDVM